MRWVSAAFLIVFISGCIESSPEPVFPEGEPASAPEWIWSTNGTGAIRLTFDAAAAGAHCVISLVVQGRSSGFEYVGLLAIEGSLDDPPWWYLESGTTTVGVPRVQANAGSTHAESAPFDHRPEWLDAAQEEFVLSGSTSALVAWKNAEPVGMKPPRWTELAEFPDAVWLSLTCDRSIPEPQTTDADAFAIYDERFFRNGAAAHAGGPSGMRFAHVGLQDRVTFIAEGSLVFLGDIGGDRPQAGRLQLIGPSETKEWILTPTLPFVLRQGDFVYTGPAGEYEVTLDYVSGGLPNLVRVTMFDFPLETS